MGQAVRARARYRLDEYATGIAEPDVSAERGLSSSHRPSSWRFPSPIVVRRPCTRDRKSVVSGKSVSVRVDLGGRGIIKKNTSQEAQGAHMRTTCKRNT